MRIVIVGYGEMLQALISGVLSTKHQIVGVFRHENVLYMPLRRYLLDLFKPSCDLNFIRNLNLYDIKANSVNSEAFRNELKRLKADLVLVGSWSEKFSTQTINTPKIASINVHPSLLPKYRGPNPYSQVILKNEKQTGVSFHLMDVNYDTGSLLHQASVSISDSDSGNSLKLKCCNLAKKEVCELLNNFGDKYSNRVSQQEKDATYFHHLHLSESILDFENESSVQIDRRIRALSPWMKCFIPFGNQFFEFKDYKVFDKQSDKEAAQIVKIAEDAVFIVCSDKKVIRFSGLKIKAPFAGLLTKLYLKKIIKINSKAV